MAWIRDKKKTTRQVDSNGNIYDGTQSGPVGRVHDGGIYDQNGNLTGRYHGGKIYDQDGPEGGKVIGQYEGGKIYDHMGYWGGNVTGHYSGDAFKEVSGGDRSYTPSDSVSTKIADNDPSPVPIPQQDRVPEPHVEKQAPRPPVQAYSAQDRGISFLMSTCRHCGSPAKVRFYSLFLVLTPFALLFYAIVFYAVVIAALANQSDTNVVINLIASVIVALMFLMPGLVALFILRWPKGVCSACHQMTK